MSGTTKALRSGINKWIKRVAGWPYAGQVRRAWAMTAEEIADYQRLVLHRNYAYARQCVPFYRDQPELYPPLEKTLSAVEVLARLPILDKAVLRNQMEDFHAHPLPLLTSSHTTSGTSGTPLRFHCTIWERGGTTAILDNWHRRILGRYGPLTLNLTGFATPPPGSRELYWRDPLTGDVFLSIYSINEANRATIAKFIREMRPQLIFGYASAVHNLAQVLNSDIAEDKHSRVAIVTSEILFPNWRETIQTNLCRRVYDQYGSQEGAHLALECEHGQMHLHPLVGLLEIVDDAGRPVPAGASGQVLVTSLMRRTTPVFRYRLGDTVESTGFATDCPCGLAWPTIGSIGGRSEDLVVTRDGRRIGYLCFHATKNLPGIAESQLVQTSYERFVFNLVLKDPTVERSALEAAILGQLRLRLQTEIAVEFRYLAEIPREGGRGKFKSVVVAFAGECP